MARHTNRDYRTPPLIQMTGSGPEIYSNCPPG